MSQHDGNTEPDEYRSEDEIDLADLVAVLHRRRWLIVAVTVLVFILGLAYSLVSPRTFEYRALLEVGQFQNKDGEYQFVEPPKAAAERIEAIAQTVYHQRKPETDSEELKYKLENLEINAAENGGVVEIILEAPKEAKARDFFKAIIDGSIQDHNRIFKVEEQKFRQKIKTQEAHLDKLRKEAESYQRRLKLLEEEESFLREQIQDSTGRIDQLLKTKTQANIQTPQEPVGLLLFSSEIQRVRSYIDELRNRLLAKIPEKRESLQVNLESTRSQITTTQAKLESTRVALANVNRTQALLQPSRSDDPVAPNLNLNLALALMLGLFLAVFVAFLYEFWWNNRERIQGHG